MNKPQGEASEMKEKKNFSWTTEIDECMLEGLLEQMQVGQKPDRSFSNTAYMKVAATLSVRFNIICSVQHLKNRLKTLKKNFGIAHDLLNASGFSCTSDEMVQAEPEVWAEYVKAHPDAKHFQTKPILNYASMYTLFGKDRATGQHGETAKERRLRYEKEGAETSVNNVEYNFEENDGGLQNVVESIISQPSASKGNPNKKLRAIDSLGEELRGLKSATDAVAKALERGNARSYTEEELFDEVMKIEGLDEDYQMRAYDYIAGDIIRARSFMGVPPTRRKQWLEMKMGNNNSTLP